MESAQNSHYSPSKLPHPLASSQPRQIFPAPAAPPTGCMDEVGTTYFVKLRGSTPAEHAQQKPVAAQPKPISVKGHRTHSDPDTFAVFTAAPGSSFGKSDSFAFLQALGDDTHQENNAARMVVAQAAEEAALGMEYSDDEEDMKMDTNDKSLNDSELMQLAHPLASLSN